MIEGKKVSDFTTVGYGIGVDTSFFFYMIQRENEVLGTVG